MVKGIICLKGIVIVMEHIAFAWTYWTDNVGKKVVVDEDFGGV